MDQCIDIGPGCGNAQVSEEVNTESCIAYYATHDAKLYDEKGVETDTLTAGSDILVTGTFGSWYKVKAADGILFVQKSDVTDNFLNVCSADEM